MSFMSVPALDRLLEPSQTESSSVQSWSAKGDRRTVMNMSPFFPSQPPAQPSPPPTPFSPSPYVLNFKRRVFGGNGTGEASCFDQDAGGGPREATSSFRGESEVVKKVIGNKGGLNEDGMLPVREVQERLSLGGKALWEGLERFQEKNGEKTEKVVSDPAVKAEEGKYNGPRRQESSRGSRSRNSSIGQQDVDLLSISSSNREEFFDAPEEPFEGTLSVFC